MLVNGAVTPATVLVDTISGLCGNTTYQFAAFITNVMKKNACEGTPTLTNLTLSIETVSGTILSSFNTGDLPLTDSKTWVQYGTYCTMPAIPVPLIIRIKNNSITACGSGFAMDEITFSPAGAAINVTVNGGPNTVLEICKGYTETYNLHAAFRQA